MKKDEGMPKELELLAVLSLTSNRPLKPAESLIAETIRKANDELFMKGITRETKPTKIIEWSIENQTLKLIIESGPYARAHAAALRFRKTLAESLGAKHRIGIRDLRLPKLEVHVPQPKADRKTIQRIRDLEHVEDALIEREGFLIRLKPMGEAELRKNVPDRVIALVEGIIRERAASLPAPVTVTTPIVQIGPEKRFSFSEEPSQAALELGWIKEFPGRGQWIYTTPYAKLLEVIEDILLEEIIRKLDFQPFMLPKLIPLEVMRRMPGYLEDIPEGMYYVCRPPREPEAFSRFKEKVKVTKTIPRDMLKSIVYEPDYVLAPAQCEPFWQFFSHEILRHEDLPVKLYDRSGWTYRWEGGGVEGLTRIQEFRRIELGYIGSPEQTVEVRDTVRDRVVDVADKKLGLEWRVVAAAPFYLKSGEVGDISESRNVAAYDIEIYLPYRGERPKAEWLEIAACFVHKTKFVDSFRIRETKNRPIWTGCCGLGISRWVAAFLAFHSFDHTKWPEAVKSRFSDYKLPRTLLWPKKTLRSEGAETSL